MVTLTVWSDLTSYLSLGVIAVVIVLSVFAAPKDYLPVPPERKHTKQRTGDSDGVRGFARGGPS